MQLGQGLEALLQPRSIAILGASQDPTKIGGRPVQFLRSYGFPGPVYPVNPRASDVQGYTAYPSIEALPEAPDLVIIALGADAVPDALEACAAKGVKGAVVFSSGFSEMGAAGEAMQARMRATAARLWLLTVQARAGGEGGASLRLTVAGLWTRLQTVPREALPGRAPAFTGMFYDGIRCEPMDYPAWPLSP